MEVEFEDGSILDVGERWIECVKMKYGMSWDEYWSQAKEFIDGLWKDGTILTKFGEEDMKSYYEDETSGEEEMTHAWHANECIYADLRSCLMALAFKVMAKEGEEPVKVLGLADDGVHVYDGEKMEKVKNIDEVLRKYGGSDERTIVRNMGNGME